MDIVKVKRTYGERICIIGNVSNELLYRGFTEKIEATVKHLLRMTGPKYII